MHFNPLLQTLTGQLMEIIFKVIVEHTSIYSLMQITENRLKVERPNLEIKDGLHILLNLDGGFKESFLQQ